MAKLFEEARARDRNGKPEARWLGAWPDLQWIARWRLARPQKNLLNGCVSKLTAKILAPEF
jgi:hypothetical protein